MCIHTDIGGDGGDNNLSAAFYIILYVNAGLLTAVHYIYYNIIIYVSRVPPSPGYITLVVIDWIDHRPVPEISIGLYYYYAQVQYYIIYNIKRRET